MTKFYTRQADLEPDDGDAIPLTLASETPVDRGSYIEVLSHDPSHVDLTRAPLPLIVQHDTGQLNVGIVEGLRVDGRRLRGVARFGSTARAQEILRDVRAGIVRSVSIGYELLRRLGQRDGPSGVPIITFAFRPFECSAVSVPADPAAGFYRNHPEVTITMSDITTPAAAGNIDNTPAARERQRIADLEKLGEIFRDHGGRELARELAATGATVDQMQAALLERVGRKPVPDLGGPWQDMSARERQRYSLNRVIRAQMDPGAFAHQAGFEFEVSRALAKQSDREPRGIFIPAEVFAAAHRRDLLVSTSTLGGNLVATDLLAAQFIDVLRARSLVVALGATVLQGLRGNVAVPRLSTGAAIGWASAENQPVAETNPNYDQVTLQPKTVGAFVDFSRRMVLQATPDIEMLVTRDLTGGIATAIDAAAINGPGTGGQPSGILASTSVGTTTAGANGAAPTWAHVVELETLVANSNADQGMLGYLTNSKVRGKLRTVQYATSLPMIWSDGMDAQGFSRLAGHRAGVSNNVPSNLTKGTSTAICSAAIFGNWADLLVGMWSGVDIIVDNITGATAGTVRVVALQDCDIAIRRNGSFAYVKDLLTA